jgi:hypothetical protein
MKTKWMTLATFAVALSPSLALASVPAKTAHSTGTHQTSQYHDRTPHVHERGAIASR